jgi:hypothetical protein
MKEYLCEKESKTNEHKIPFPKKCHPSSNVLSYLRCFGPFEFRNCQPDIHQYKENSQAATQLYSQGDSVIFVPIYSTPSPDIHVAVTPLRVVRWECSVLIGVS